jgi:hypothetical protein
MRSIPLIALTALCLCLPALNAAWITERNQLAGYKSDSMTIPMEVSLALREVRFTDGETWKGDPSRVAFDPRLRRYTAEYPWGSILMQFDDQPDAGVIRIRVDNRSRKDLEELQWDIARVTLPETPRGWAWAENRSVSTNSMDDVAILIAPMSTGVFATWNHEVDQVVGLALVPLGRSATTERILRFNTAPQSFPGNNDAPIPSGGHRVYTLMVRIADPGSDSFDAAPEIYAAFKEKHPPLLQWEDRRPIAMVMIASSGAMHKSASNPRGWFSDPNIDALGKFDPERLGDYAERFAHDIIKVTRDLNAQGVIIWDVEGQQYPNITYVGDPRMIETLAPEMDRHIDFFFETLFRAGLRVGVCIRPSRIRPATEEGARHPWRHINMGYDIVEEMSAKIDYAKERWGCTLFYIDTNVNWGFDRDRKPVNWLMRAELLRELVKRHPDVLLVPEFGRLAYYGLVAPYGELRSHGFGNVARTSDVVRKVYPEAFRVINIVDGDIEGRRRDLVRGVKEGDVLMTHGWWWAGPHGRAVVSIYQEAAQ